MEKALYKEMSSLEKTHWWFLSRRKFLKQLMDKYQLTSYKGKTFLEIGPGTGGNYQLLSAHGSYESLEPNDEALSFLVAKKIPVTKGEIGDHNKKIDKKSAVFLMDVLEHIEDDWKALIDIKDLYLRSDGLLIMSVPADPGLWSSHDEEHHHFRRYTKRQMTALLKASGYEVLENRYYFSLAFPLLKLARFLDLSGGKMKKTFGSENFLLGTLMSFELLLNKFPFWRPNFGSSLFIVAKKES